LSQPLIELTGITRRFGALGANDSIDLTVMPGEIHALLGENGAGKSTLMKILYGLLSPDAGEIRLRGRPVELASPQVARANGIGMVFQHFSLFEDFTALENIAIPLDGAIADRRLANEVMEKAKRYGLEIDLHRPVHTLSAGERQRIEILRVLMQDPSIIILDEPTSVLTPQEADGLFDTLRKLASGGAGILFISHKLDEVRGLCSAATILRGGKRIATTDPRAVSAAMLAEMMVGESVAGLVHRPARGEAAAMLALDQLSVRPEGVHGMPLQDVSIEVRAGEVFCIAGVAGNGQSEFYAAISGEEGRVTRGRIRIGGEDVTGRDINARRRAGAAFVPEARLGQGTLPNGTLSENVVLSWHATEDLGGTFLHADRLAAIAQAIIRDFDVRVPNPDPEARKLSGGNLQKYIVGREIRRAPRLIVIDQPSWGVDAKAAAMIRQTLLDLAEKGVAVLVITQDLDEAFELADRIAVMRRGRLSAALKPAETTRAAIGLMMTGRDSAPAGTSA
jgi:general nucleoside transport system ATP-binding protein